MFLRTFLGLLSLCMLCNAVMNMNGCDVINAVKGRDMVEMTCPVVTLNETEKIEMILWQLSSEVLDPASDRYEQQQHTFTIFDILPSDEGVYSCIFEISNGMGARNNLTLVSSCIIVQATAIFETCQEMQCQPQIINVNVSEEVTIDSRVSFTNGGACGINQSITLMVLDREDNDGATIFACSNEGEFASEECVSNSKVVVTPPGDHKYDVNLTLINVTEPDSGKYFLRVEFINDSGGRDCLFKNFTLNASGSVTTTALPDTSSNTPTTSTPSATNTDVAIAIGVTVAILVLVLIVLSVVIVFIIFITSKWRHRPEHKEILPDDAVIHISKIGQESHRYSTGIEDGSPTETYFSDMFASESANTATVYLP